MTQNETKQISKPVFTWSKTEDNRMKKIFEENSELTARQVAFKFIEKYPETGPFWKIYKKSLEIKRDIEKEKEKEKEKENKDELENKFKYIVTLTINGNVAAPDREIAKQRIINSIKDINWNSIHIELIPVIKDINGDKIESIEEKLK